MEPMKPIERIRQDNFAVVVKDSCENNQTVAADKLGYSTPSLVNRYLSGGKDIGKGTARKIESVFGYPQYWMDADHSGDTDANDSNHPHRRAADFGLVSVDDTDAEVGRIEYWNAKGSCGGGFLNYDELPAGHLVKEASFFSKYNIKPLNAFAIYADGNSMADFIVDGDIVIFDKSKREPRSGKIFVIDHPEGLRIKQLRRDIDGSWVLESKNVDKRTYPDERISPDHGELLKICGEFVYRQGG